MFLGEKHCDVYSANRNQTIISDVEKIVQKEKEYGKDCTEWDIVNLEMFLKSIQSISPNTLARSLKNLREYVAYIAKKENIKPTPKLELEHGRMFALIDYDKLLAVTLNPEQYIFIKNQLDMNIRDKVIFELAWLLLSVDDIKNIKESDIVFETSEETGLEIAYIKISDTQTITIEDLEVIQDIKKCMTETTYYVDSKDARSKNMKFRASQYLIKSVNVGVRGKDDRLSNPSSTLQDALIQQDITCPGINVEYLNVENVRRSKIIYLLAPQNAKYFDRDMITAMLDAGNVESNLLWLQRVAKMKYGK